MTKVPKSYSFVARKLEASLSMMLTFFQECSQILNLGLSQKNSGFRHDRSKITDQNQAMSRSSTTSRTVKSQR